MDLFIFNIWMKLTRKKQYFRVVGVSWSSHLI